MHHNKEYHTTAKVRYNHDRKSCVFAVLFVIMFLFFYASFPVLLLCAVLLFSFFVRVICVISVIRVISVIHVNSVLSAISVIRVISVSHICNVILWQTT